MTVRAGGVILLALVLGCDGPVPGTLRFQLESPRNDDGAVDVVIRAGSGRTIGEVEPACSGCRVFARAVGDGEVRAVIAGPVGNGPFLVVPVSDVRDPDQYTVTIRSVAGRDHTVRRSLDGYRAPLAR